MLRQAPAGGKRAKGELMQDADEPKGGGHTLADHAYGIDLEHVHDGFADHDHDFPDEGPLEENPIWIQDHVSLMSVGIDIGSKHGPGSRSGFRSEEHTSEIQSPD